MMLTGGLSSVEGPDQQTLASSSLPLRLWSCCSSSPQITTCHGDSCTFTTRLGTDLESGGMNDKGHHGIVADLKLSAKAHRLFSVTPAGRGSWKGCVHLRTPSWELSLAQKAGTWLPLLMMA